MEDNYAKPEDVAGKLVDTYARLVDISPNCIDIAASCGHIAEGLGDVYAAFLHICRLADMYVRTEDVARGSVECDKAEEDPDKFNVR